ncbi:hypothetical protein Tco_1110614 [Tanacetum coccineum]|uniref:Uncharacterized protein n=1 Tax=Tanacetum coccineum TaxID=301880 RepID=A0ABQ5IKI7_9ASTR
MGGARERAYTIDGGIWYTIKAATSLIVLLLIECGCGGGGSVEVVSVVAVKLEGTPADAVRALKKLVCFRLSIAIL